MDPAVQTMIDNLKKNAVLDVRTVVRPLLTKELGKDPFDNIFQMVDHGAFREVTVNFGAPPLDPGGSRSPGGIRETPDGHS